MTTRYRIVNGDIAKLRKRKRGRPRKPKIVPGTPEFPDGTELREFGIRDGFRLIRSRKRKLEITQRNLALQARFDFLCSEVKILDPYSWEYAEVEARMNSGKVGRIEKTIPSSFCSCKEVIKREELSCLLHGLKDPECGCGGIDEITGYRTCTGHRKDGMLSGVAPFETERMTLARRQADTVAREIGWL